MEKGFGGKMFKSQKHVFWEALLVTIFIFGIGIILGIILENWRTSDVDALYQESEIELLDIKLQNELYSGGRFNCEFAVQENLKFADKIYEEAKLLEKYENARRLTKTLIIQHKKYDILRTMLFLNSIEIKENCKFPSFYNIVYFYIPNYEEPEINIKTKQKVFSNMLEELKVKKGNEILLIPIAVNQDISSINIILDKYDISREDLPVILINEKIKISNVESSLQIEQYLT